MVELCADWTSTVTRSHLLVKFTMESSLQMSNGSQCHNHYLKLTEDEEKHVSAVLTPDVMHRLEIWLLNIRRKEMESGSVDNLGDVYAEQAREICNADEIAVAHNMLYLLGLRALAETAARHIPDKQAKLIDVAAGNGDLGVKLKQVGFTNIDALEPTKELVNLMPKDLYGKVYTECIQADKQTSIPNDTYDYLLASGSIYTGHIEVEAVLELIRIIKPGGCLIFNISEVWIKHKDFGSRLDAWFQSRLEDGILESVLKERSVYLYKKEECNHYIVKKSSNK